MPFRECIHYNMPTGTITHLALGLGDYTFDIPLIGMLLHLHIYWFELKRLHVILAIVQ